MKNGPLRGTAYCEGDSETSLYIPIPVIRVDGALSAVTPYSVTAKR